MTAAREALAALQPKHTTQDSLYTVRWKISGAVKRRNDLEKEIDSCEHALQQILQAERTYRELLQAIAVQEKAYAEAMEAHSSIEGQGQTGGKLQDLLLKQLMEETNRHLTALISSRYALRPAGENVLAGASHRRHLSGKDAAFRKDAFGRGIVPGEPLPRPGAV